jgi:riboflavin biosynthesis pyrimidine reductase
MPDDPAAVRFTVLDPQDSPAGTIGTTRLPEFYAYPDDVSSGWVRGNMIASLDGGATDNGTSGTLGGAGDRTVFSAMRELADVILVGAGTVRAENYSGVQFSPAQRQARQDRGQAEVPPIAVVSNRGVFDHDAKLFTRTEVAPLILTAAASVHDTRNRLGSAAEVIAASGARPDTVDPAAAVDVLADRGLRRVLCEGGPQLLGSLVGQGLLDELCLTIAPLLVGGAARRIITGPSQLHAAMRRRHLLSDDAGYLYARYIRGA